MQWLFTATVLLHAASYSEGSGVDKCASDIPLPHENDCTKFYKCDRGLKLTKNCPTGLHFNPILNYCDWPSNVECQKHTSTELEKIGVHEVNLKNNSRGKHSCPMEYNGKDVLFNHPTNCTKFLHCDHGQPIEKDCPAGLYFNSATDRCDWPWNVKCNNLEFSTTLHPDIYNNSCPLQNPPIDVLLPHESDCTKFYKCDWGQKIVQSCPTGLYFNVLENYCDWPEESYCWYNKQLMNGTVECFIDYLSGNYFLPHESDCQKFYVCHNGTKQSYECPQDLYFNLDSYGCEELEDISCPAL